jgi:hypothetical protein
VQECAGEEECAVHHAFSSHHVFLPSCPSLSHSCPHPPIMPQPHRAPEFWDDEGEDVTDAADVFALGCVMWEMAHQGCLFLSDKTDAQVGCMECGMSVEEEGRETGGRWEKRGLGCEKEERRVRVGAPPLLPSSFLPLSLSRAGCEGKGARSDANARRHAPPSSVLLPSS